MTLNRAFLEYVFIKERRFYYFAVKIAFNLKSIIIALSATVAFSTFLTLDASQVSNFLSKTQNSLFGLSLAEKPSKTDDLLERRIIKNELIQEKTLEIRNTLYSPFHHGAKITSPYGWRIDPINKKNNSKTKKKTFHYGVDMIAAIDDSVYSAGFGVVRRISYDIHGGGNYVLVDHLNGFKTAYLHLSKKSISIKVGDTVSPQTALAVFSNSGRTNEVKGVNTGKHLHLKVLLNNKIVNPMDYVVDLHNLKKEDSVFCSFVPPEKLIGVKDILYTQYPQLKSLDTISDSNWLKLKIFHPVLNCIKNIFTYQDRKIDTLSLLAEIAEKKEKLALLKDSLFEISKQKQTRKQNIYYKLNSNFLNESTYRKINFTLQIYASSKPLSKKKLHLLEIKFGVDTIYQFNVNGFWKEAIGNYKTIQESRIAKKELGEPAGIIGFYKSDKSYVGTEWSSNNTIFK